MGYRHTITSEIISRKLPEWYKEKYSDRCYFQEGGAIASKTENKYYDNTFFDDTQKALIEVGWFDTFKVFRMVALSEDGAINKVLIYKGDIQYSIADDFRESDSLDYYFG